MTPAGRPGEFETIRRFFAPLAGGTPGALGLTDDAAFLDVEHGQQLVVTSDALVAGVHFLVDDAPADIAAKALRVNLSDLAAMGARPLAYTLAAVFDETVDEAWLDAFSAALAEDQKHFGISLVGGDTVATPGPLTLSVCAFGTVENGKGLTRSGAKPGDLVFISGTIGDAAIGLDLLKGRVVGASGEQKAYLTRRYRRPQPRCRLGPLLIGLANAAIDVSDGLVADLGHICEVSGVSAVIDVSRLPLSDGVRHLIQHKKADFARVLTGGDDYEILFTVPAGLRGMLAGLASDIGLPLTEIGCIGEEKSGSRPTLVEVVDGAGQKLKLDGQGFRHF